MAEALDAYRAALDRVVATARRTAREQLRCELPPVRLELRMVAAGAELLAAAPPDMVLLSVSDPAQLQPPPRGANTLYGVCHEVGHLLLAPVVPHGRGLPVVWDEAFAHLLAVEVFLPAVWAAHGPSLWPDAYPDYLEREVVLPEEPSGHLHGSVATLRRSTAQLRSIADRIGAAGLLEVLGRLPPHKLRVETLGPALQRASGVVTPTGSDRV